MSDSPLHRMFDALDRWRHLPAYQLERRADVFFGIYLHGLLEEHTGVPLERELIPELPLKLDVLFPDGKGNQSVKVDYAAFARDRSRVFFVELKTDAGSRRDAQDTYLEAARGVGFARIAAGVRDIARSTTAHQKYYHLLHALASLGFLKLPPDIEDHLYPKPRRGLSARLAAIEVAAVDPPIEILYVQPEHTEGDRCISFDDVAAYVRRFDDPLSQQFARHVVRWKTAAGSVRPLLAGADGTE